MTQLKITALSFFAVLAVATSAAAQQKHPATARTEAMIDAFKAVKPGGEAKNTKQFAALDDFLDFDRLTTVPLEPRKDKFTPAQLADTKKKFRELIRLISYPDSGDFFREAKLTWGKVVEKDGIVSVPFTASVSSEDLETEVTIHWANVGGKLKVADVSFDGESLVKDYTNQFTKIIDKEGAAGLIKKLDEKRAQLDKATVK